MAIKQIKCPKCGGIIEADTEKQYAICQNCGKRLVKKKKPDTTATTVSQQIFEPSAQPVTPLPPQPTASSAKKGKKGCLIGAVIAIAFIAIFIIIMVIVFSADTNNGTSTEKTQEIQQSEQTTMQSSAQPIYEDKYIKASFIKVYSDAIVDSAVDGVAYLQLKVENKSSQTLTVSLSKAAINGMSTTIGSGMPMTILPGNASEQPFILFTNNTGVNNADDIKTLQFSFYLFDENLNKVEETKTVNINIK